MRFERIGLPLATAMCTGMLFFGGCRTNIAELPITDRDREIYSNPYAKEYKRGENSKAIKLAIIPQAAESSDKNLKTLTANFGDGLETAFSNLSDFQVVSRSELGAILADKELASLSGNEPPELKIKNVNYLLIYKINSYNFESFNVLGSDKPNFRAYIKIKVTLVDTIENQKEFTKTIIGQSQDSAPSGNIGLLNQAVENAVKDFVTQFAVEYAPPAIVQQTKGSGQVALLNLGKDFGLMKEMKIEFFEIKIKDGKKMAIPFGYGKVIEIAEDTAWVEVDNFEKAGVRENNFARVRKDQSKSYLEKLGEKVE